VVYKARNRIFSFGLNYPVFPDGCPGGEFALVIDGLEVFVDGANILAVKFGHKFLRQPDGTFGDPNIAMCGPIVSDVDQELPGCGTLW
jgi:hypothetical protein